MSLSLSLVGCGGSAYFQADQTIAGVSFDWGRQKDRDALPILLSAPFDPELLDGAWVKFTPDATHSCPTDYRRVAGCYRPDLDLILVEYREHLQDSALLHELTHRAQWLATGYLDYDHSDPQWWGPRK